MNIAMLPRFKAGTYEKIWDNDGRSLAGNIVAVAMHFGVGLTAIATKDDYQKVCDVCDGLIVPGSAINIDPTYYGGAPFDPPEKWDEFALDRLVIEAFEKAGKPILGICGGIQALNVYFGGTLKKVVDIRGEDYPEPHSEKYPAVDAFGNNLNYRTHPIRIEKDSFVYDVFGAEDAVVNSYHSWALDRVADGFRVVARTHDGVIEAFENKERKIFGTQWHPELCFRMGDDVEKKLFENFLNLCK